MTGFTYSDGGRAAAGYKGVAGDCVTRAIAIATGKPYAEVYDRMAAGMRAEGKPRSARNGIDPKVYKAYLEDWLGWTWTPTMAIGSGCTVHLLADELPSGTLIVRLSGHLCAVIDGVVYDASDPRRGGTRCVYGFWQP